MNITSLQIENFRGIKNKVIDVTQLMVLLGKNGAGKSSVLDALKYALTGDCDTDDIHKDAGRTSVTITFADGTTITRIRDAKGNTCKANGKTCTGKALDEYLTDKVGANTKVITAMCGSEFYETMEQKDLTKFVLSILPVQINFDVMIQFLREQIKDVSEEQIKFLQPYFAGYEVFGLQEIEDVYKKLFEARKVKKELLKTLQAKAVFDKALPPETKDQLQLLLGDINFQEAKVKDYQKNFDAYNKSLKQKMDAEAKLRELMTQAETYKDLQKPSEETLAAAKKEKAQFEGAINNCNNIIATNKTNIQMYQKTLDNLDKPICPISEKLVCSTDKSGLRQEMNDLITKNNEAIKNAEDLLKRCTEQVTKRNEAIDAYNKALLLWNNKVNIEKQIADFILPTVLEKPEEVKYEDVSAKKLEINTNLQLWAEYEASQKYFTDAEKTQKEVILYEFGVNALDVKKGVRSKILEKSLAPLEQLVNQKADKLKKGFKISLASPSGLDIQVVPDGSISVPMGKISAGEFMFAAYLIMSVIREITGVSIMVMDNIDKLDEEALKGFIDLIAQDNSYENVFIAGVNHAGVNDVISSTSATIITM